MSLFNLQKQSGPLVGAHVSIAGGMEKAFARGEESTCAAIQVFTKNASQWKSKPLTEEQVNAFRQAWEKSSIGPVMAHDSYLINLASPEDEKWTRAWKAFLDEMQRCSLLGIPALVMHPGAHMGSGEEAGIRRIAEAFKIVFDQAPEDVTVLLENTAAQGTVLGGRFEHLSGIMELVPGGRFGVCFDTCHAFVAGYNLSTAEGYAQVFDEFERHVGCDLIETFHLNDAKKGLGSRLDRHEHIGQGTIGTEGFAALMQDKRFIKVPKIIETPKGDDGEMDLINLGLLRRLAQSHEE